mmetsp:Transcript_134253/g.429002  ORF Transcript_134253/g.429002 Transcript_134253/m.429002 type:complete len:82 (-) Transcript_134253:127-372(-)
MIFTHAGFLLHLGVVFCFWHFSIASLSPPCTGLGAQDLSGSAVLFTNCLKQCCFKWSQNLVLLVAAQLMELVVLPFSHSFQ